MDILVRGGVEVVRASLEGEPLIRASRGTLLVAETKLSDVAEDDFDLIALPGGLPGADYLRDDLTLRAMLQNQYQAGRLVGAICAAPQVLVAAGILDNKKATSYPGVIDQHPAKGMTYVNQPVVVEGNVITSQGPATAMAFALALLSVLQGESVADRVAQGLLFKNLEVK
jgi:4-methyl-5(b-hydroxyethyl)-thiazole monophosphate biosynthesis